MASWCPPPRPTPFPPGVIRAPARSASSCRAPAPSTEPPLAWCQQHPLLAASERVDGRTDPQHFVPLADWEAWAPFTMVPRSEAEADEA